MLASLARYPTFQIFLTLSATAVIVGLLTPLLMNFLKKRGIGQQIRAEGIQEHLTKHGTPTMGGVVIMLAAVLCFALIIVFAYPSFIQSSAEKMANFNQGIHAAVTVLICMLGCGMLGFIDDMIKVAYKRSLGLTARAKIIGQVVIATTTTLLAVNWVGISADVRIPLTRAYIPLSAFATKIDMPTFLGGGELSIPWLYLLFALFMIIALTNAVNLTDGLDGLAAGVVTIVVLVFGAIAYVEDSLPLALAATAIAGGCIGFLWWNCYPADIFMGDTGSLGLGGAVAGLAMVTKTELLVIVIGGLFVIEALSVVIQVAVFKRTRKRVFKMAPIHHHFEMSGWSETKIMVRFWVITGCLAALGFALFFFQNATMGP